MGSLVEVISVDTTPTKDMNSYNSSTFTQLWIFPEEFRCGVSQESCRGGITHLEYIKHILAYNIDPDNEFSSECENRYNEIKLEELLNSEVAQDLLNRVCSGWFTEWDGQNLRGCLNEDATSAIEELLDAIRADVEQKEISPRFAEDWLMSASDACVYAYLTDDDLNELAEIYLKQAEEEGAVYLDSVIEKLTQWRDEELGFWVDRAINYGLAKWDMEFKISHHWFEKTILEVLFDFGDDAIGVVHVTDSNITSVSDPFDEK
jgi:hypothetical protein